MQRNLLSKMAIILVSIILLAINIPAVAAVDTRYDGDWSGVDLKFTIKYGRIDHLELPPMTVFNGNPGKWIFTGGIAIVNGG